MAGKGRQPSNAVGASDAGAAEASRLDRHRLAHHGAAVGQDLELGDGTAAGRRLSSSDGGRHGAQAGGRGLLHEGAHSLRLAEHGIHGDDFAQDWECALKEGHAQIEGGQTLPDERQSVFKGQTRGSKRKSRDENEMAEERVERRQKRS